MTEGAAAILMAHPTAELYGSDRVFLESVTALVMDRKNVVVTLPVTGPLERELIARGARVEICGSPVLRKSMLSPRGFVSLIRDTAQGILAGSRLLRREKPDAVYVSTVTIPLWNVLAKLRRIPLIVHVHEGEASAPFVMRTALALPLLLATVVIANSSFSVSVIERSFKRLARRARVVYNAVPGPERPSSARGRIDSPARLTYIGRLSPRKGVDVAIDALAILEVQYGVLAELDLVGAVFPGYEWYEEQLHEQVVARKLENRVRFHGFQPSIWDVVGAGDVVVVPSRGDEPFGNTAVEAILAGRPVIASATSGLIEATAGYHLAHTVSPGDPAALATAIQDVVHGWNTVGANVRADQETAYSRHSPRAYQEQIAAIVGLIVARPATRVRV